MDSLNYETKKVQPKSDMPIWVKLYDGKLWFLESFDVREVKDLISVLPIILHKKEHLITDELKGKPEVVLVLLQYPAIVKSLLHLKAFIP